MPPPPSWRRCRHSLHASALQGPHAQPAALSPDTPQVGHLLGLGDRHLDNMLLHRRGGHLLHIDFSIVFDRCAVWWWQALVRVMGSHDSACGPDTGMRCHTAAGKNLNAPPLLPCLPPTLPICRGLQLKVPEVVPFRLTQTLVEALGVAGACLCFAATEQHGT